MNAFQHPWLAGLYGDEEIAAILSPEAEIARMLEVEAAWSRANGAVDVAVEIAGLSIAPEDLREGTARDGLPVPSLVRLIRSAVSKPDHVHEGLTSQDVIDTSLMLALKRILPVFAGRLLALTEALMACRGTNAGRDVMAYTRMQPALPTNAGHLVDLWLAPLPGLARDLQSLSLPLQWGGPIGARDPSAAETVGPAFAEALGLADPGRAWHTDRTKLSDLASLLSKITGVLGKIGQDVALMASRGDIALSGGGGSSAMPHKQNPILAEALVTLAHYNAAALGGMHHALVHEQQRSGSAWGLEQLILPDMIRATGAGLLRAQALVSQIQNVGTGDR